MHCGRLFDILIVMGILLILELKLSAGCQVLQKPLADRIAVAELDDVVPRNAVNRLHRYQLVAGQPHRE